MKTMLQGMTPVKNRMCVASTMLSGAAGVLIVAPIVYIVASSCFSESPTATRGHGSTAIYFIKQLQ